MYVKQQQRQGIIYLVSGPSGSGKSTLCRRLAGEGEVAYSISCTTRPPRGAEQDGIDYHFLSREAFESRIQSGDFLEYAEVHGNFYGTLKSEVIERINQGTDVVMDIDVQGADLVRSCEDPIIQTSLLDLFVMPPSEEELHSRLTGRGTDSEEIIALRMKNALDEIAAAPKYTYLLLSGTHEEDYPRFKALLIGERLRASRLS
ncbi:guanylate kinase [Verrucomicrobiaceae bacterium N1E253]|uniref:Guanylate kinase n=1 Tax=Oceaniferula marina TaxID=2748318 RepID=A0A851GEX9_9BACT|nr:guanylate kinase [Oceaniferula marina]NWK56308.1 guanylate kinase [Oceaniferula marina]